MKHKSWRNNGFWVFDGKVERFFVSVSGSPNAKSRHFFLFSTIAAEKSPDFILKNFGWRKKLSLWNLLKEKTCRENSAWLTLALRTNFKTSAHILIFEKRQCWVLQESQRSREVDGTYSHADFYIACFRVTAIIFFSCGHFALYLYSFWPCLLRKPLMNSSSVTIFTPRGNFYLNIKELRMSNFWASYLSLYFVHQSLCWCLLDVDLVYFQILISWYEQKLANLDLKIIIEFQLVLICWILARKACSHSIVTKFCAWKRSIFLSKVVVNITRYP